MYSFQEREHEGLLRQLREQPSLFVGLPLVVDYSMRPTIFSRLGWPVVSHPDRNDVVTFDVSCIERVNLGHDHRLTPRVPELLRQAGKFPLDVRVMEELLAHKEQIPSEWNVANMSSSAAFWGTVFGHSRLATTQYVAKMRTWASKDDWKSESVLLGNTLLGEVACVSIKYARSLGFCCE